MPRSRSASVARQRTPDGPAGSIDAIPVPAELTPREAEVFRMGARAALDVGYRRGASAGHHQGKEDYWSKP